MPSTRPCPAVLCLRYLSGHPSPWPCLPASRASYHASSPVDQDRLHSSAAFDSSSTRISSQILSPCSTPHSGRVGVSLLKLERLVSLLPSHCSLASPVISYARGHRVYGSHILWAAARRPQATSNRSTIFAPSWWRSRTRHLKWVPSLTRYPRALPFLLPSPPVVSTALHPRTHCIHFLSRSSAFLALPSLGCSTRLSPSYRAPNGASHVRVTVSCSCNATYVTR